MLRYSLGVDKYTIPDQQLEIMGLIYNDKRIKKLN